MFPHDKKQANNSHDRFQDMVDRYNNVMTNDGSNGTTGAADHSSSSKSIVSDCSSFESSSNSSVDIFKPCKKTNSMSFFDTLDTSMRPRRSSSNNLDELEQKLYGGKHRITMKCVSDHGIGRIWDGKKKSTTSIFTRSTTNNIEVMNIPKTSI